MKNVEPLAHHNSRSRTQNVEVFMKNVEAPPAHYNSRSRTQNVEVFMKNVEAPPAHYNSRSHTILPQQAPTPTPSAP